MEKNRIFRKRVAVVSPDGSYYTDRPSGFTMLTEDQVRTDIEDERISFTGYPGVQAVEEANDAYVLTVVFSTGRVRVITYREREE